MTPRPGPLPAAEVLTLESLIAPVPHGIASRVLAKNGGGTVTLFAFDAGTALAEHTAPFDALVQVLEGRFVVTVAGQASQASSGTVVRLPANVPHAVEAIGVARMLLTMLRETAGPA